MKKSKIWIRACVHLLLCITLGAHTSEFGSPVTDDITRISLLKQNIPKDYKIPVEYVPKQESGMCWVKLNVFYLENSLEELAKKFGNISSNRYNISIFVQMLQEIRTHMGPTENLDLIMFEFECHYRKEQWQTGRYFEFVEDFLKTAQSRQESPEDCEPPPCPTTTTITTTTQYSTTEPVSSFIKDCDLSAPNCKSWKEPLRFLPEVVERSLLSLLLIPVIAAIVFLFVWKVKARRNQNPEQSSGEGGLFTGTEGNTPPLNDDISEKNRLNVIEAV